MNQTDKKLIEIEPYQLKVEKRVPHISKSSIIIGATITLAVIVGFTIVCLIKFFV